MNQVTVTASALREVLQALVGPGHYIRELQCTRGLPGTPNAIDVLINEYNAAAACEASAGAQPSDKNHSSPSPPFLKG